MDWVREMKLQALTTAAMVDRILVAEKVYLSSPCEETLGKLNTAHQALADRLRSYKSDSRVQ